MRVSPSLPLYLATAASITFFLGVSGVSLLFLPSFLRPSTASTAFLTTLAPSLLVAKVSFSISLFVAGSLLASAYSFAFSLLRLAVLLNMPCLSAEVKSVLELLIKLEKLVSALFLIFCALLTGPLSLAVASDASVSTPSVSLSASLLSFMRCSCSSDSSSNLPPSTLGLRCLTSSCSVSFSVLATEALAVLESLFTFTFSAIRFFISALASGLRFCSTHFIASLVLTPPVPLNFAISDTLVPFCTLYAGSPFAISAAMDS